MANNDEKQHIDENVQDAEVVDKQANKASANRWLWLAIVLLFLLTLAVSGWIFQQLNSQQQSQSDAVAALETEIAALGNSDQQIRRQFSQLQQDQQTLSDKLEELLSREALSSADIRKTWALQEIDYLLTVANQRALLAQDISGARQALNMADQQLKALSDYRLHPLRALIAEEMMALDELADLDIAGMALQLQAAAKRVDSLRVKKGPEVDVGKQGLVADSPETQSSWKQAVNDIWQQLRSLVVIRHDQSGEAAVLVPEQRYFLYQNLRLQLESARLALLNADAASYQHSLNSAAGWLEQYFTGDERDAMLTMLKTLQEENIAIAIPDISGSLNWLEEYQR